MYEFNYDTSSICLSHHVGSIKCITYGVKVGWLYSLAWFTLDEVESYYSVIELFAIQKRWASGLCRSTAHSNGSRLTDGIQCIACRLQANIYTKTCNICLKGYVIGQLTSLMALNMVYGYRVHNSINYMTRETQSTCLAHNSQQV